MEIGFGITCMVEFIEFDVTHERSYIKKKRERLKMEIFVEKCFGEISMEQCLRKRMTE